MMHLAWVDTETTGLDPSMGMLLEVAILITTTALEPVELYHTPIAVDLERAIPLCDPFVQRMHTSNHLFQDISLGKGKPIELVREEGEAFIRKHRADGGPMCGSTVSFDRAWLKQHASALEKCWTHQHFDVSTLRWVGKLWSLSLNEAMSKAEPDAKPHRAAPDILASLLQAQAFAGALEIK